MITDILINGEVSDGRIPVTDSSVLRGDACFEVIKAYHGSPFALQDHLERLERSAGALEMQIPAREHLASWIEKVSGEVGDGAVRVVVTRGSSVPDVEGPSNVIVFGHTWDRDEEPARLYPVVAPWHAAGVSWDLAGAKITSYAPNLAATRRAQSHGFEDALLITTDQVILEGPTFAVGWVIGSVLETPGLQLGILDSITRRLVLGAASDLGFDVVEGTWTLDRLDAADEVMAWSTIREVQPVVAIGERTWQPGPVTGQLADAFRKLTDRGTNQR